jgi:hypothetical protein
MGIRREYVLEDERGRPIMIPSDFQTRPKTPIDLETSFGASRSPEPYTFTNVQVASTCPEPRGK